MNARDFLHFVHSMDTLASRGIRFLYKWLIRPKSGSEDSQRHEFILNILLCGSIILLTLFDLSLFFTSRSYAPGTYQGVPFLLFSGILGVFILLLVMSRKGSFQIASFIMLGMYYAAVTFTMFRYGIELPLVGLGYVIIIVMASILVSTRFGFIATLWIGATVIAIGWMEVNHIVSMKLYWKSEMIRINDAFQLAIIFLLIMTISWLSNREIESSLKRARRSERDLKLERDNLELKVEERTRELKEAQIEKTANLYRMAEFGRLSSGLFHDLMNPLQGVIAAVDECNNNPSPEKISQIKEAVGRATHASQRMGNFLGTIRKQIKPNELDQVFSLNKELREAVDILRFRARTARVVINIRDPKELSTFGNPLKFHQVMINLLVNAIDACDGHTGTEPLVIHVKLTKFNGQVLVKITDHGCGIPVQVIDRIFDPFFTTKSQHKGMGLGLSTTRSIIEKDFGGTISVTSDEDRGTTFTVLFPFRAAAIPVH